MASMMNDLPRHEDIVALLQSGRLLRMHVPHGNAPQATLVVSTLFAQEELSRGFRFDAELLSDDASIPLKDMIARMITVSLVRDNGTEQPGQVDDIGDVAFHLHEAGAGHDGVAPRPAGGNSAAAS